jgi:hypothetical protein
MLSGARAAGWDDVTGGDGHHSGLLAEQALTILSGYDASVIQWDKSNLDSAYTFLKADYVFKGLRCAEGQLEAAAHTPFILEIEKFDLKAFPHLENVRWEQWITVMAYDHAAGL